MIGLLFQLAQLDPIRDLADAESATVGIPPGAIGYVVLTLIVVPVVVLVSAAIFGSPRNMRVPGLFLACVGVLISAMVLGFALFGSLLGFFFPI